MKSKYTVFFCFKICTERESNLGNMLNIGKRLKCNSGTLDFSGFFPPSQYKQGEGVVSMALLVFSTGSNLQHYKNKKEK